MQVRWKFKLQPNKGQQALMAEWLVTLRKHRNYCLAERKQGFETNNQDSDERIMYQYGAFSDIQTKIEYGSYCPLTCPVVKHGVMSAELTKTSKKHGLLWGNATDIQSKRTTQLRSESEWYARINADVLQGNLAKLDAAYSGFFQHKRGFPAFRKASNFNSFQFKPGQVKLTVNRASKQQQCYSHAYLPGLGNMRYIDSRSIPIDADIRTVTVIKEADGWYMSVLLNLFDHADTQASRTILKRANLTFVSKDIKILRRDSAKVTVVRYDSARPGEQNRGNNPIFKAAQLNLFETGIYRENRRKSL